MAPELGDWLEPYSWAVGVGNFTQYARHGECRFPSDVSPLSLESLAVGVGQDEQSSSEVGGSHGFRRKDIPFSIEPEVGQVAEHEMESPVSETWNILQEHEPRSHHANDSLEFGPEPPFVRGPISPAGDAPRLAGEAGRDDIHSSTPRAAVEGLKVIPDRRFIQDAFFHARDKDCR